MSPMALEGWKGERANQKCFLGPLVVISESLGQGKASSFPWWPEGVEHKWEALG